MLVLYWLSRLKTAGAFFFLEYVGMKSSWPGEERQVKMNL